MARWNWPQARLSADDVERVRSMRWKAFDPDEVIDFLQAWNAGVGTEEIRRDLGLGHRASVTLSLGALIQKGVDVRRHYEPARAAS